MKNKYGFCKGLAALVLLMLCALTIKDNAYAQTAKKNKVLFIGNSHTYYNDMPNIFKGIAKADGIDCEVSSITSAGYKLSQFADTTDTYGALVYEALTKNTWDYVVVQENRAVLVEKEYKAESAVNTLHSLIKKAGAKMIIYATQPNNIGSTFSVNSTSFYLTDLQIEQILTRNNFKIANDYEYGRSLVDGRIYERPLFRFRQGTLVCPASDARFRGNAFPPWRLEKQYCRDPGA